MQEKGIVCFINVLFLFNIDILSKINTKMHDTIKILFNLYYSKYSIITYMTYI
jgi:hypothetical protein